MNEMHDFVRAKMR